MPENSVVTESTDSVRSAALHEAASILAMGCVVFDNIEGLFRSIGDAAALGDSIRVQQLAGAGAELAKQGFSVLDSGVDQTRNAIEGLQKHRTPSVPDDIVGIVTDAIHDLRPNFGIHPSH